MLSSHFYGGVISSDNTPGDGISLWDYEKSTWVLGNKDSQSATGKTVNNALKGNMESNSSARTNNAQATTSSGSSLPPYIAVYVFKRVS